MSCGDDDVKLNSDLARGMHMAVVARSPNERISKHEASTLWVLRNADVTEAFSSSSRSFS